MSLTTTPIPEAPLTELHAMAEAMHLSEPALRRRYSAQDEPKNLNVAYEFTDDPALLYQYYELREQVFINVWGLKNYKGGPDKYDRMSDILVVRKGKLCVGGARLTNIMPHENILLPMEGNDFQLKKLLPELNLSECSYGECGKMALLPDYRNKDVAANINIRFIRHYLDLNMDYMFWIAPTLQARNTRQSVTKLGYDCKILSHIKVPEREEYEGIKMHLVLLDFTGVKNKKQQAKMLKEECIPA